MKYQVFHIPTYHPPSYFVTLSHHPKMATEIRECEYRYPDASGHVIKCRKLTVLGNRYCGIYRQKISDQNDKKSNPITDPNSTIKRKFSTFLDETKANKPGSQFRVRKFNHDVDLGNSVFVLILLKFLIQPVFLLDRSSSPSTKICIGKIDGGDDTRIVDLTEDEIQGVGYLGMKYDQKFRSVFDHKDDQNPIESLDLLE